MSASTRSSNPGERFRRLARGLVRLADLIGAALFAAMFLSLVFQVVLRFVFGTPAAWTEELATIAFVWVIFWGCAFSVPLAAHVAVDFLVPRFAPAAQRVSYAVALGALAVCFLWALPGIADYLRFMMRERTPVLDLPFGIVYAVFLAAAAMVALRCFAAIARPRPAAPGKPDET